MKNLFKHSKEYFIFTLATMASSGVNFAFSIYAKRLIDPLEYGIYSTCLILQTYMSYLQLGSQNAFNRDYPQLVGSNNWIKAEEYRNTTFTFLLIIFGLAVISIGAIAYACYLLNPNADMRYLLGYFLCALITALSIIESFGNSRARIDGNFIFTAIVLLLQLFSVLFGVFLLHRIGYYALYITTISSLLIAIALYYKRSYSDIKLRITWKILKVILLSGLPLLINSLIWTVVNTIDKFVILGFLDTEALGVYAIAQNAFSFIVLIPNALSQIFYVRMGREYGKNKNVNTLNQVATKFTTILAMTTSFVAIGAYYMVPMFVKYVLPNYVGGIKAAQILIVGLAVYAPTLVNGNILTILKENATILRSSIYLCIFDVFFSVLFVLINKDISSVAYGTAVAYVARTFILVYQITKYAKGNSWQQIKSSIIPVIVSLCPAIMFYNFFLNWVIGMVGALFVSVLMYAIIYRKSIIEILKKEL